MNEHQSLEVIENTTLAEIRVGQTASLARTLTEEDIAAFAAVSGDTNPAHMDPSFASQTVMQEVVGHGMWTGSIISTILGTRFPGPGTIYLGQTFRFKRPVHLNDTVTASVTVTAVNTEKGTVELDCKVVNQKGAPVLEGVATILAPTNKHRAPIGEAPRFQLFDPESRINALLAQVKDLEPVACVVVHPCDESSLRGAILAAESDLIRPILVGPIARIRAVAESMLVSLDGFEIVDAAHSHESAKVAARMVVERKAEAMMKGSLHTHELIEAVLAQPSLRTKRRMSHVFRFDVPLYGKPLLVTDAGLNINPSLMEKADIAQNAIHLAHILGLPQPKLAVLSAVETVNPEIQSTIDAAALCKMADRGQIVGALVDGPLAFDNAISPEAVKIKGIESKVAGDSDILLAPDLESANILAKQLEYLSGASGAGVVLGARIPIALTSRADNAKTRLLSALLTKLVAHHYRKAQP